MPACEATCRLDCRKDPFPTPRSGNRATHAAVTPSSLGDAEVWRMRCVPLPLLGNAHQQRSLVDNWICNISKHMSLSTAVKICVYTSSMRGTPLCCEQYTFHNIGFSPSVTQQKPSLCKSQLPALWLRWHADATLFPPSVCHLKKLPMLHRH